MRWIHVVALGLGLGLSLGLAGCAANVGGGGGQMTWARVDGRPVDSGFQAAAAQCRNTASRAGGGAPRKQREEMMMAAMQSCMQQRGYVWRCEGPLGELAQGSCTEADTSADSPADKGRRPARS